MSSLTTVFPSSLMQLHSSLCHLTYTSYLWVSFCQLAPKKTALLVPKPHHLVVDISITTPSRPIPRLVFLCCCPCCVPAWPFFQKEKGERERDWPKNVIHPDSKRKNKFFFLFFILVWTPFIQLLSPDASAAHRRAENLKQTKTERIPIPKTQDTHTHTKEKA